MFDETSAIIGELIEVQYGFAFVFLLCLDKLVGRILVRRFEDGRVLRARITETEAYFRETDTACHARFGRTKRSEVLYRPAGTIYVYLCYGIHWMLNLVTGPADDPQAVLIRGVEGASGPGRVTKFLGIDGSMNDTALGEALALEDDGTVRVAASATVSLAENWQG